jgi:hypothetical protein
MRDVPLDPPRCGVKLDVVGMQGPTAQSTASPGFSRRDLLHRAADASRGWENVMHASHEGIGRGRCGVFYVKAVRQPMGPAGIDGRLRPCAPGLREMNYLRRFSTSTPSRARAAISASEKPRARSTASPCSLKRGGALRAPPGVLDSFIGVPRPR